jgi:hypothetical protein
MEASKSCIASRLLPYGRTQRSQARGREATLGSGQAAGDANDSHPPAASAQPDQKSQALAQEQAVFDRKMDDHGALFKLQMAMGWATFVLVPITVIATLIYPPAAAGMVPLTGVAAWNWRRMLKRNGNEIEVLTEHPDSLK